MEPNKIAVNFRSKNGRHLISKVRRSKYSHTVMSYFYIGFSNINKKIAGNVLIRQRKSGETKNTSILDV